LKNRFCLRRLYLAFESASIAQLSQVELFALHFLAELLNASLAAIPLFQGQVKGSYLIREKRLTAASHPQAAEESPP
jgi:hypothetical protein